MRGKIAKKLRKVAVKLTNAEDFREPETRAFYRRLKKAYKRPDGDGR